MARLISRCTTELLLPSIAVTAALALCSSGCTLLPGSAPPTPTAQAVQGEAVSLAAAPARRLLVTSDENQSRSRLLVVWLRLDNTTSETLAFNPDEVTLTFADGMASNTLDRARADLLIQRFEVAPTDEAAADYPALWALTLRPGQQPALKRQLSDGLLTQRQIGTESVEGYIVFDTRQRAASLEGAALQIPVVRSSDAMTLKQSYRFTSAPPAAARVEQQ